jgi:hypothetical protein
MTPTDLITHLRRQPFRPFRLHLSDGSAYDVRHPELALVTLTEVAVAIPAVSGNVPERMIYCDPFHITRVEPLPENIAGSPPGNGQSAGPAA